MDPQQHITNEDPRLSDALGFLQQRGLMAEGEDYTARQMARELARRGWRWHLDSNGARATKAYTPTGTISRTITATGPTQADALAIVLAEAIQYDDEHGLSLFGSYHADVVIWAPDDRVIAVVEVKNREQLTQDVAITFHRSLIADGRLNPHVLYFLFVSQDTGFLWDQRSGTRPFAEPDAVFPMGPVVAHYVPWFTQAERLGSVELEFAVARWLEDLARRLPERPPEADAFFAGTEFVEAIQGARVYTDPDE